jgi:hypothetical protein
MKLVWYEPNHAIISRRPPEALPVRDVQIRWYRLVVMLPSTLHASIPDPAIVAWLVRPLHQRLDQNALTPLRAPSFRLPLDSLTIQSERQLWPEDLELERSTWLVFPIQRFFLALDRQERKEETRRQLGVKSRLDLASTWRTNMS